ncbi:uncharacterized protein LOC124448710 [Xenia sp. Carnegie-2017]|uniref:uncharacterized protein LOC124448710 n=1 Tax=Xenia sp. Carnegie-2017 TaxID=2897299 RepID=UPI001F04FBB5|nr:uncharacterized protein LOC124448710 [Xenia sp. Carnegie-2017]
MSKIHIEKRTDDYELRCYPSYTWVGTSYTGKERSKETIRDIFLKLFHYINGGNANKTKMEMTVPAATRITISTRGRCSFLSQRNTKPTHLYPRILKCLFFKHPRAAFMSEF